MTLSHELRTPLNAVLGWVGIFRIALALRAVQDQRFDDETAVGSGSC
jgi:signal transduction histidine kinase